MQTLNILLVDDHPIVRAGLRAVLAGFDDIHVVAEAADGSQALERARALQQAGTPVDVVVMDIQMKPMDGITATAAFTAAGGPPVLILTTFDTQSDIIAALEAGALGYLLKDAPPEQVHAAVRDTAAGKNTLSPDIAMALVARMRKSHISLSAREKELLTLLATGATNKQLAQQLFISEATVKTHLVHIYSKLGVDNRTGAISRAREEGLL